MYFETFTLIEWVTIGKYSTFFENLNEEKKATPSSKKEDSEVEVGSTRNVDIFFEDKNNKISDGSEDDSNEEDSQDPYFYVENTRVNTAVPKIKSRFAPKPNPNKIVL